MVSDDNGRSVMIFSDTAGDNNFDGIGDGDGDDEFCYCCFCLQCWRWWWW